MQFLILGMAALVIGLLIMHGLRGGTGALWRYRARIAIGILILAVALGLFARGATGPAVALATIGFGLIGGFGRSLFGPSSGTRSHGQSSQVVTDCLDVAMDHDTGAVTGQVIKGTFRGRAFETLNVPELVQLWQDCVGDDPPSAQVIEAVLDRDHPGWQDGFEDHASNEHASGGSGDAGRDRVMTRDYAYQVLGLKPGASADEIRAAHRELMQKMHPDRGGSTVLAAQINEAKDVLLG